jgi:UPF0716 family protein affecting phage T7 exclusion
MKLSFGWVFVAFLADMFSLFILSDAIGAWWTLGWVLTAMVLGVWVIMDAGDTMRMLGGVFATPMERMDAIKETPWLLLTGVLLFIPGVLSDFLAVLFWLPALRKNLFHWKQRPAINPNHSNEQDNTVPHAHYQKQETVIIEGDFIEKPIEKLPPQH